MTNVIEYAIRHDIMFATYWRMQPILALRRNVSKRDITIVKRILRYISPYRTTQYHVHHIGDYYLFAPRQGMWYYIDLNAFIRPSKCITIDTLYCGSYTARVDTYELHIYRTPFDDDPIDTVNITVYVPVALSPPPQYDDDHYY